MDPADLNELLNAFIVTIKNLNSKAFIVGPGMVSGQPQYLDAVDLSGLDAIAVHPYAQWPETVNGLLKNYAYHGKNILITEFGWPEPNWQAQAVWFGRMLEAMHNNPQVLGAINYCWDDAMNPNFGVVKNGVWKDSADRLLDFSRRYGLGPLPSQPFQFVLGFKAWHDAEPALIGDPKENEFGGIVGQSRQLTTTGVLSWDDLKRGQEMTFLQLTTGKRYRWNGTRGVLL